MYTTTFATTKTGSTRAIIMLSKIGNPKRALMVEKTNETDSYSKMRPS